MTAYSFPFPSEFEQDFHSVSHFHEFLQHPMNCIVYLHSLVGALSALGIKACMIVSLNQPASSKQQPGICALSISKIFISRYQTEMLQTDHKSIAMVKWNKDLFLNQPTIVEELLVGNSDSRPVKVHYFARVSLCGVATNLKGVRGENSTCSHTCSTQVVLYNTQVVLYNTPGCDVAPPTCTC